MSYIGTQIRQGRRIAHDAIRDTSPGELISTEKLDGASIFAVFGFKYQQARAVDSGDVERVIEPTTPIPNVQLGGVVVWQSVSFVQKYIRAESQA